ncbi:MAG: DUF885 domain-containing protein [Sphingomonadales bacterium]|nr:DUF885 domain-containing protein [Sphingomonadales bacterium]NCO49735.1 DUF885 domain-containing protein [Sphingomonadales bacterium]NCP00984.1 DUF885 domain-containing protein [Sphingomonadales bacterium]NCP25645.1 DUF885 domain-containing protein [Sphingomonadales bacterium]NCP49122.1 DUF885 domain-containing protein [Sphingomonadales bacterium]
MRKMIWAAGTAVMVVFASPVMAQDNSALKDIADQYWAYQLDQYPEFASSLGVDDPIGRVSDASLEAEDARVAKAKTWLAQLDAIDTKTLSEDDKTNYGILRRTLAEEIEANGYGQRVINFTNRGGWHQNFASMQNNLPFRNAQDYRTYINRLKQYAKVNDQSIAVANQALAGGYVQPCVSMEGYETSISGLLTDDPKESRFYQPFTRKRPETIDAATFASLADEAADAIKTIIDPAVKQHLDWYTRDYAPKCAKAPGISAQPGGAKYYDFRIRQMTTTAKTADEIHNIGLSEVKRIRAEMVEVAKEAGYDTREAFIEHLRTDPQYYAKTPEELMEKVARVTKMIDGKMPSIIGKLARLPYGIKEIPAETAEGTTTAYYNPGSPDIGIAGYYYVNTSKLDQRPFWEIPALSVHEAVPGHHQQIALQQELDMPDFRKHGAFFTAFVEGWGLYSERLGIEMELYDTPAKNMGRLSYEMWRAARLVVDTGIHSKGWSKQRAIDFMTDNTALSSANIEAEVNRYISWPAQALAYKMGELKIRELRSRATSELGEKFDLREFHDVVLGQGAVPLDMLEAQVNRWIEGKRAS